MFEFGLASWLRCISAEFRVSLNDSLNHTEDEDVRMYEGWKNQAKKSYNGHVKVV